MKNNQYKLVKCKKCGKAVKENWLKQHIESGCKKAAFGTEIDYIDVAQLKALGEYEDTN